MAWLEAHQALGRHRKILKLSRLLGVTRAAAVGHMLYFWWWCLDNAPDGGLDQLEAADISDAADWSGDPDAFVDALVACGWLDETPDGLVVHDWESYAGRLIDKRQANAERMRAARAAKKDKRASNVQRTRGERAGATEQNSTEHDPPYPPEGEAGDRLEEETNLDPFQTLIQSTAFFPGEFDMLSDEFLGPNPSIGLAQLAIGKRPKLERWLKYPMAQRQAAVETVKPWARNVFGAAVKQVENPARFSGQAGANPQASPAPEAPSPYAAHPWGHLWSPKRVGTTDPARHFDGLARRVAQFGGVIDLARALSLFEGGGVEAGMAYVWECWPTMKEQAV